MELSSFSQTIVKVPYVRNGDTTNLEIDIDAFTPEFFRGVSKRFEERLREWAAKESKAESAELKSKKGTKKEEKADPIKDALVFFENEALTLEVGRQIHAELLAGGVLKGWDLTKDGLPILPSYDVLMKLPPLVVEELWNLALNSAQTVKKRVAVEAEATSENSLSGTRAPLALAPTG